MNFTKKIINLIMTAAILTSCFICVSKTALAADDYTNEISFITDLGITGYNKSTQAQTITRGEFALSVAQAIGMDKDYTGRDVFSDVTSDKASYGALTYLYDNAIVSGYGDMTFMPDKIISYEEALKIVANALGYAEYASVVGGYSVGYKKAALDFGIDIRPEDSANLTKGEAALMIYKLLGANYLEIGEISAGGKYTYKKSEETVMKRVFKLNAFGGIVTATRLASIYGDSLDDSNKISIDFKTFNTSVKRLNDFLGFYVDYYVDDNNNVVSMQKHKNQKSYDIKSKDIQEKTTYKKVYYKLDKANKELEIASDAYYVYNGRPLDNPSDSDLKPFYGELKLIDNNNDKKADVVLIWSYKTYYIKSATDSTILLKDNDDLQSVKFEENGKIINLISGNNFIEKTLVAQDSIINYCESKDKTVKTVFVTQNEITGTITGYDSSKNTVTIDDLEYDAVPGVEIHDYIGRSLAIYLDKNDAVAEIIDETGDKYGVIQKGYYKANDEQLHLRIFNDSGFHEFTLNDDQKLDYGVGEKTTRISVSDIRPMLFDSEGKIKKQLVKYSVNSDGTKITGIVFAEENSEADNDRFRMNFRLTEADNTTAKYRRGRLKIDSMNKVFYVSGDITKAITISDEDKKCNFMAYNKFDTSDMTYPAVELYNIQEAGWVQFILINMEAEVDPNLQDGATGFVVDTSLRYDSEKEEARKVIKVIQLDSGMIKASEYTEPDDLYNTSLNITEGLPDYPSNTVAFGDLQKGDVIKFTLNPLTGEVNGFGLVLKREDFLQGKCTNRWKQTEYANNCNYGEVIAIDENCVKIQGDYIVNGYDGSNIGIVLRSDESPYTKGDHFDKVIKYNRSTDEFTLEGCSWSDIYKGEKIYAVIPSEWNYQRRLFVIMED